MFSAMRVAGIAFCIAFLVVLITTSASAFRVTNRSGVKIHAWVPTGHRGNFDVRIHAGREESCHYSNKDCNRSGDPGSILEVWIDSDDSDSHFSAILPLEAGGEAIIKDEDRGRLGVNRKNIYVESWKRGNVLLAQTHYGIGATSRDVRFLVTGDPQYFKFNGEQRHRRESDAVFRAMVGQMSASECNYPRYLAGCKIRGMIVAGDLTQQAKGLEMDWYRDAITGAARFAYDGLGNHDYNGGTVKDYILRDRRRSTVATSVGDPHYSWDWHDVHLVQLNLFVGNNPVDSGDARYDPYHSLDFLRRDLRDNVGGSGRPVILIHHYGFDSFSRERVSGDIPRWWGDHHRWGYWDAIAGYNVKAIFNGHNHLGPESKEENWHLMWSEKGGKPIHTFNAAAALMGTFLEVKIDNNNLTVQRWGVKPGEAARTYGNPVTIPMR
jgi:hypothetical protein